MSSPPGVADYWVSIESGGGRGWSLDRCVFFHKAARAVPGSGRFYRFRTSFAAHGTMEAFAFHSSSRTNLLSGLQCFLCHQNLTDPIAPSSKPKAIFYIILFLWCRVVSQAIPLFFSCQNRSWCVWRDAVGHCRQPTTTSLPISRLHLEPARYRFQNGVSAPSWPATLPAC